jgi:hypothetical protein
LLLGPDQPKPTEVAPATDEGLVQAASMLPVFFFALPRDVLADLLHFDRNP